MNIKKYIPDSITSLNLLCGVAGVVFVFRGRPDIAFPLMILGAVFDFCDGLAARVLGAYSDMGRELDSLADMVTFGVLPSLMLSEMMRACTFGNSIMCWIPLLIAVFSGLRLAKFNVDERQHTSFIGLPTPACAMLCGSLCYYVAQDPASFMCTLVSGNVFVPVLSILLCFLLVCGIPMFSMKFSKSDDRTVRGKRIAFAVNMLICALVVAVVGWNWSLAVFLAFAVYILMNIAFSIFRI